MAIEKTRRSSWFVSLLTVLVILQSATPAWAWGRLGHRVIAPLAEKHMTPEARAAVTTLLEPGESLADASLWADHHRDKKTAPWHYVDVPLDEPRFDRKWSADDAKHGCVVDKISDFRKVVGDKSKPVEERRFALPFLIHCIEDVHQPCHVGDNHDRGGNDTQVRWFDTGSNMRGVWDSGIIERNMRSQGIWLAEFDQLDNTAEKRKAWMCGTVEDWATESLLAAREAYLVPGTDKRIKSGQKLGREYQASICRSCGGLVRLDCGWRWCPMRRFRATVQPNESGSVGKCPTQAAEASESTNQVHARLERLDARPSESKLSAARSSVANAVTARAPKSMAA